MERRLVGTGTGRELRWTWGLLFSLLFFLQIQIIGERSAERELMRKLLPVSHRNVFKGFGHLRFFPNKY